jgi:hypothetical protein
MDKGIKSLHKSGEIWHDLPHPRAENRKNMNRGMARAGEEEGDKRAWRI